MTPIDPLRRWIRRARLLLRHAAVERAMDDEIRHHLECETADRVRAGQPPAEARRAALRAFGGVEQIKEEARDVRGVRRMEDAAADVRYSIRVLRRNPAFTTAAMLTFMLGIGAAGAIFTVAYGVVLRPLPYADPDRLVAVWERNVARQKDRNVVSLANFEAWRDRNAVFEGIAALVPRPVTMLHGSEAERVAGAEVSTGYFRLLGVAPALGRDFVTTDASSAAGVVVVAHAFWVRAFGSDPNAVGRTVQLSGKPHTVIGVMPASFEPPAFGWLGAQDLWFPFNGTPQMRTWGRFLLVVGRLRKGTGVDRARADLTRLAAQLAAEHPANKGWSATVVPLAEQITGEVRTPLLLLLGAVGLLLVMAVTNVATLTVSMMRRRGQELATRRSLGATDRRLLHQLATEGALIGAGGTAAGLLLVGPLVRLLVALTPADVPRLASVHVDLPVVGTIAATAFLATIVFATTAAVRGRSLALAAGLKNAGDGRSSSRSGTGALMAAEVAVALALTVAATLMVRSFSGLRAVDLGFDPDGVVAARVSLVGSRFTTPAAQQAFFDRLLERVRGLPGVTAAGRISARPMGGVGPATEASDPLQAPGAPTHSTVADIRYADASMFQALRMPVVRGTSFDGTADAPAPLRIVVSEALAAALWPGQDAVGRRLHLQLYNGIVGEIAGVVRDVHLAGPRTAARPIAFLPDARFPSDTRDIVVRVAGDAASIVPALRRAVADLDPAVALYQPTLLADLVDRALASDRFITFLLAAFAAIALALGGVGVVGVISGDVARRRKEIGIRMALGASTWTVNRMMLARALVPASWGVAAGTVLAATVTYSMRSLLFGVAPHDTASFAGVAALLLSLATVATLIPTRRAIQASPLDALREG